MSLAPWRPPPTGFPRKGRRRAGRGGGGGGGARGAGRAGAAAACGVPAEVAGGALAQGLDVGVRAGDVGRLSAEEDLDLGGGVDRPDLARYLPRALARRGAGGRAGGVVRLRAQEDRDLGGEVDRPDLARYLLRVLARQVADVQVVGAAVGDAVEDVAADDPGEVHARVREEVRPLGRERELKDP